MTQVRWAQINFVELLDTLPDGWTQIKINDADGNQIAVAEQFSDGNEEAFGEVFHVNVNGQTPTEVFQESEYDYEDDFYMAVFLRIVQLSEFDQKRVFENTEYEYS